jgi:hypothetical protein
VGAAAQLDVALLRLGRGARGWPVVEGTWLLLGLLQLRLVLLVRSVLGRRVRIGEWRRCCS